jgi:hypothetical protein
MAEGRICSLENFSGNEFKVFKLGFEALRIVQ